MIDAYRTWSARTGRGRADLARVLDVHLDLVRRWLRGESEPRPASLRALADVLGADPVELMRQLDAEREARWARIDARATAQAQATVDAVHASARALADVLATDPAGRVP